MRTSDPGFVPPFCPRFKCRHHRDPTGWKFEGHGVFERKARPRIIRRFRCLSCRHAFSTQSFDTTYYLKRPDVQRPIHQALVACAGMRQAGRSLGIAGSSVQRQASRLGRHCLLFQRLHGPKSAPNEELELDGLMSFEYSQYWPFEVNVLVGSNSHFFYGFTESDLRRSGRMTAAQKAKRESLEAKFGRPDPLATRRAVEALISMVAPGGGTLTVHSDEHQAYPLAFRKLPHAIRHATVSSRRNRSCANPLFRVDLLDLLLRHSGSNHKRETIAFSKRRQGALERVAVFQTWRNFIKRTRERDTDGPSPAQTIGIQARRLDLDDLLHRRIFPTRVRLPSGLAAVYWRRVPTRQIQPGTTHRLRLAA